MWWLMICGAFAAPLSPAAVVDAALENASDIALAEARVEAAKGARYQSGGPRYNPQLQLGASLDGSRVQGQLVQPLSVTGEGVLDRRSATASLEAAEAALTRARLETAAAARRAYAHLALAQAGQQISEKQLDGASRLRSAAEARLGAGEAPELDVQLARLEEARAIAVWLDAGREVTAARSELVAMTGLSVDVEVESDPMRAALGVDDVGAATSRSDVIAAAAEVDAAEAALARERAAILPPLGLGAFYEADDGRTVAGPMLTAQVPIWKQNQGGTGAARGALMAAQAGLEATEARAQVEANAAAERLDAMARAADLLGRDLTADAAAALSAIQDSYALGQTDLTTALLLQARVIEGERGWYEARTTLAEARIEVALTRESPSLAGSGD